MKYGKEEFVKDMEQVIKWNRDLDVFIDALAIAGLDVDIDKLPGVWAIEHFIFNIATYLDDNLHVNAINKDEEYHLRDIICSQIFEREILENPMSPEELYDSLYEEFGR